MYHKAYKAKQATNRRKMADPRLAARRRAAKFTSDSDDLVIGRNAVLEALRVGVPSMQLYIATRIEHDDRTREIIKLAGAQSLHLLEADRLEMDRMARLSNHQGVVLKVQPYQYSFSPELADIAERKAKAMDVVNSPSARINARPLFIALDGVTDPQNLGAGDSFGRRLRCQRRDSAGASFRFGHRCRVEGIGLCRGAYPGGSRGEPHQGHRKHARTWILHGRPRRRRR